MSSVCKLRLKVVPGASSTGYEWFDDEQQVLKVRVRVAPEKGKANKAVEKFIASILGLPSTAVNISSGSSSPQKTVKIAGLTLAQVKEKLFQQS